MIDTILFEDTVGELRAALVKDSVVVEVLHQRPGSHAVAGARYRGRVRKIDRGMNAAFVDIGEARDGFARARDLARGSTGAGKTRSARVETLVAEGQYLGVRVVAAPHGDKGARLVPDAEVVDDGPVGLAQAAPGLVAEVLDRYCGLAVAVSVDGVGLEQQVAQWAARQQPPAQVGIEAVRRASSLFEERGVEAAIAEALGREVALPGGGRVVFDRTEALHVIDVDSGGRPGKGGRGAYDLNLAAMDVVARQVRLRRLAGAIVIDAVRMQERMDGDAVLRRLRAGFANDPVATEVLGYSRMGLIEVSRQRSGVALADLLTEDALSAAYGALRMMQRSANPQAGVHWRLVCGAEVAEALSGPLSAEFMRIINGLGLIVEICSEAERGRGQEEVVAR